MKVCFIGLGIMGSRMAMNLLKSGQKIVVYNRTRKKAQELINHGAVFSDSLISAVKESDVITLSKLVNVVRPLLNVP